MADEVFYERVLRIEASPATVFDLLTTSDGHTSWMGFGAELDPRPGGVYHVDFGAAKVSGSFVEVERDRRVVFTWGWEGGVVPLAPGESTVEITLTPDGSHTILRLRHTGLTDPLREFHAWGWDRYLPRLAERAAGRDPGEDPMKQGPPVEQLQRLLASQQRTSAS